MARKKDTNSVRQRGVRYVDEHHGIKTRQEILSGLMDEFNKTESYAKTIYALWRKQSKERGELVATYEVRDFKDGLTVDPYMFRKYTESKDTAVTEVIAKKNYEQSLRDKIKLAKKL